MIDYPLWTIRVLAVGFMILVGCSASNAPKPASVPTQPTTTTSSIPDAWQRHGSFYCNGSVGVYTYSGAVAVVKDDPGCQIR